MSIKNTIAKTFRCILTIISPKLNTKIVYRIKFGKKLDLDHPITLNEKILWLKLNTYYDNPLVKQCADKLRVREYVEKTGCSEILNCLIAVYEKPEQIEWDTLPDRFVIKLNIGCGYNLIIPDKKMIHRDSVITLVNTWLKSAPKTYLGYSEMQYKDVKPFIIVEKYLGGPNGELPVDYKFYCINGKCELIMPCTDRQYNGHGAKYFYYDSNWKQITNGLLDPSISAAKPANLEVAIQYAEKLSKPFPFVRVDLYLIEHEVYFGELTFTPAAGMDIDHKLVPFDGDDDIDHIYGKLLTLPDE